MCCRSVPLLIALAAAASSGCARQANGGAPGSTDEAPPPLVEVVQAREGVVPLSERLTGTVRAAGEVTIYPEADGPVVEVYVQNGDTVKKGDPLVRIQATGGRAQLLQAQRALDAVRAQHRQAQARHREVAAEYERNQALADRGLVPRNTADSLRAQTEAASAATASALAQVQVAEAAVAEQRDVQAQTVVRAPISGRVGQRNVEVGMRVSAQTPLFVMGRLERMRVEVPVAQDVVTRVREGQRVELRVTGRAQPIVTRVSRISPFLQSGSFSAEVEIDVPNDSDALLPGMFVTVDVFYGETDPTTLVPVSAVYENPSTGERGVFATRQAPAAVIDGEGQGSDAARLQQPVALPFRTVEIVAEAPQTVGVTGIEPGEWVVVVGQHLLAQQRGDGEPRAAVRAVEWDRILELQQLQRQDLLKQFMDRQRRTGAGS